ncbi:MAG: DUF4430 domain-containing protein [Planctomycetes bacterium]|nr:DUF4430 domain-containing protein [Planctomycetota bacterium]
MKFLPWMVAMVMASLVLFFLFREAPPNPERPAEQIEIEVEIDFGPIDRPKITKRIRLPSGSTVLEATQKTVPLKQGFVCCDARDVETIAGVSCDPENEGWWLYQINGESGPASAYRHQVFDGDKIRWFYRVKGSILEKARAPYATENGSAAGRVQGRVICEGRIPELPPYTIHKNHEVCTGGRKAHPCSRTYQDARLWKAVVWLEGVQTGKPWPPGFDRAVLDQEACVFDPHFLFLKKGGLLEIRNSDPVSHNVHAYDQNSRGLFNVAMASKGSKNQLTMDQPGVFDLQCDAGHNWMKAHVIVLLNPYFTTTERDGSFVMEHVPPGSYSLHAWHDLFGEQMVEV